MAKSASQLTVAEVVKAWNKTSSNIKKVVTELETTESALKTKIKCNKELQSKLKNCRPDWLDIEALAAKTKAATTATESKTAKPAAKTAAVAPKAAAVEEKKNKANTITVRIVHPHNSAASAEEKISFDTPDELKAGLEAFASKHSTYKVEPYVGGRPVLLSGISNGDCVELKQKDSGASV
jgi:hypothetical protein